MSGDGKKRRCHPVFATFVGDYPEQVLVAGAKYGLCPKGIIDGKLMGSAVDCVPRSHVQAADACQGHLAGSRGARTDDDCWRRERIVRSTQGTKSKGGGKKKG
jgi:hypothetical protein